MTTPMRCSGRRAARSPSGLILLGRDGRSVQDQNRRLEHRKGLASTAERIEYSDSAGVNRLGFIRKEGSGSGGMAYVAHSDVVPAGPWLFSGHGPFEPTVRDDKLQSCGSCDLTGSTASLLAATGEIAVGEPREPVMGIRRWAGPATCGSHHRSDSALNSTGIGTSRLVPVPRSTKVSVSRESLASATP